MLKSLFLYRVKRIKGCSISFFPKTTISKKWRKWQTVLDMKSCRPCREHHGKIYAVDERIYDEPPLHEKCRCAIIRMLTIAPGGATKDGENGADYWLRYFGGLPGNYISRSDLRQLGWSAGKSPEKYAPGKMMDGGVYFNDDGKLPEAPGRIWHEADINYYAGRRNGHRILFSNDGLIFVTYDHYMTFYEVGE